MPLLIDRRTFIKLSMIGATGLVAGCSVDERTKEQLVGLYGGSGNRVHPYVNQPDGLQDGVPQWYATTCTMCSAGCGLVVRTLGGRAVKVEGNPNHPINLGASCARAQASLQTLYNPDRLRFPKQRSSRGGDALYTSWDSSMAAIASQMSSHHGRIAVLTDAVAYGQSPVFHQALERFARLTGASAHSFGLMDGAPWRAAASSVYGQSGMPYHKIDEADYLLAFNANFLEAWPSPVMYGHLFGEFRQGARRAAGQHGRFVFIGPRMSMTAAKADRWLPCRAGTEGAVALGILGLLGAGGIPVNEASLISEVSVSDMTSVARDFAAAGKRAVALGGDGSSALPNASETLAAIESLNAHVGSPLAGVAAAESPVRVAHLKDIQSLQADMAAGKIDVLLIVGQPNPVFSLPQSSGFAQALARVPFIAALSPFEDETTELADLICPTRTSLEEWMDNAPLVSSPGTQVSSIIQPVIDPSFIMDDRSDSAKPWMDTRPILDILADLTPRSANSGAPMDGLSTLRASWADKGEADLKLQAQDDSAWLDTVGKGGFWTSSAAKPEGANLIPPSHYQGQRPTPQGSFTMIAYPQLYWSGGRHSNLPWLQEITDPMTAAVWNSWVEINQEVANTLDINTGDIVRLTSAEGSIELPALPYPAIHPEALGVPIGQGHTLYGRTAQGRGGNPLSIADLNSDPVTGAWAYGLSTVRLEKVRSAQSGFRTDINTLVTMNDIPGGREPDAIKGLIHETAVEKRAALSQKAK